MKTDLFQSCGHCWVFQICWHIECSTFTALSFRIRNSSTGIPSPPLALFVVMLSKAHLSSHSRMSGSRWVITPWWLSWLRSSFLYSSSVYSCHLFLISSASVRSIPFLSLIEPIFAWNVPLVSLIFLILANHNSFASITPATAKSLQSCQTLCNPIDSSPPGSPVSDILQARTLEWVAISFSNAWKWKVKVKSLSLVRL